MNEHGDILPYTPMKKIFNLRWYIQHLMDESEDGAQNPLSEENWMKQNNCKFIKYVIHNRHPMTPEQLKQKPFEEIFKNQHEKVDTDEGESTKVEEEYTTSEELTEEYSTVSDMSKQDSESDINVDETQHQENSHTPETLQNNTTIHDNDDLIHHENNTSENENINEIENRKVEGIITYSTDQQIFKFKVNSWGVNIEFTLNELKCTIHAIFQHMGFYHTTENPCVMMRAKHNTKSCECIIIHQDELYIASSSLQEILHIVKEKYKIKIISNDYQGSDFPHDPGGTMIC